MTYPCIGVPLLALLLYSNCVAQSPVIIENLKNGDSAKVIYYLPAHKRMTDMQWRDSIYRFPSFASGQIMFATGFSPDAQVKMNYNLYYMQMDYISANGDTLQVKPSKEFKLINLIEHVFLYDVSVGYIEVIQELPVALGIRSMMIVEYIDQPFGGNSRGVGFTPFATEDQRGAAIAHDRYYSKGGDFFFIDKDSKVYQASSSAALKLFRDHKKTVKRYIDEHKVDFSNRDQLINLLMYCNGLK